MGRRSTERVAPEGPRTVRCEGQPWFRGQSARDLSCLLEFDDAVDSWRCLSAPMPGEDVAGRPDFLVRTGERFLLVDAQFDGSRDPKALEPWMRNLPYECWPPSEIATPYRLQNARDLLRFAGTSCSLDDRIRLLTALEDAGELTLAEASCVFRETWPMRGVASLTLQRFVSIELDEAPIGPETRIRRWRR
jgi:hypothetical protein